MCVVCVHVCCVCACVYVFSQAYSFSFLRHGMAKYGLLGLKLTVRFSGPHCKSNHDQVGEKRKIISKQS